MVRTLRITSIVVAVLGVGLFVFFGFRSDPEIERFLKAPSVIDKFKQEQGERATKRGGRESGLVREAGLLANYLNPPAAPVQRKVEQRAEVPQAPTIRPEATPKFTVLATVFNESDPEQSVAWIDAPGKGRFWIRQSAEINHLTIEQIRDGVVVAKGSKGTFELEVKLPPQKSYILGSEPGSSESEPADSSASPASVVAPPQLDAITATDTERAGIDQQQREQEALAEMRELLLAEMRGGQAGAEAAETEVDTNGLSNDALMQKIIGHLEALRGDGEAGSDKIKPSGALQESVLDGPVGDGETEAGRVSAPEAEKLGSFGEQLGQDQVSPGQADVHKDRREEWKERRARMLRERAERARALAERKRAESQ
jgi:hypothetical protein